MKKYSSQARHKSAMEAGDHFKNGASPKSQTNRGNQLNTDVGKYDGSDCRIFI
jgi:hypothetical protein